MAFDYSYQPLQGPGSINYGAPNASGGAVPNVGASYLDSMANYGLPGGGAAAGSTFGPELFQGISQGLGAFTSLAQIYGMFQSLGLQKKAFKFAQEGTKRNFNAEATAFNEAVASKETARHASAAVNGQDYNSLYAYGTGQKIDKWT